MKQGSTSVDYSGLELNLDELAAFIGCGRKTLVRVLTALGIRPARVTPKGKGRWNPLKSAQIRRVFLEYNRLRGQTGYSARQMRHRYLHLSGAERLERYYLMEKQRNRERAEKKRARNRALRAWRASAGPPVVAGLAAGAAAVREPAMPDAVEGGPTRQALQSSAQPPAGRAPTDPESSGDLAL